jgi:hypothetical protein
VRNLGESTCFEHAETGWDDDVLPIGIGNLDGLETWFKAPTYDTRHKNGSESYTKGYRSVVTDLIQTLAGCRVRCVRLL